MQTRSMTRRLRSYRKRVKNSTCRGKGYSKCKKMPACKNTRRTNKMKQYCRKKRNQNL